MSNDSQRDSGARGLDKKSLKVTDRRMFTPDGELREEFQEFSDAGGVESPAKSPASDPSPPQAAPREAAPAPRQPTPAAPAPAAPTPAAPTPAAPEPEASEPEASDEPPGPGMLDLVRLLAEHASIYLSEARGGNPQAASQNLELARLHIDLLAVLEAKTKGNLTSSEAAMLEDAIYQLRAGYVGIRG
ncbi:MAG: DUF1844 domain-containing protein [Acidobacteriota bacterium]